MIAKRQSNKQDGWELLTHTGPGTPGGELLRRYWQPVLLSDDLPSGSPPKPMRILGEELVLIRDDQDRVGLLGRKCAHRCADLSYGRLENGGLRCIYHGWLYDVNGNCLEQPAEPDGGRTRGTVRQLAYPCIERCGAIWAYMGPVPVPLFPNYPALAVPDAYRHTSCWLSHCNYLQGNEGNIDPVHTSYLHRMDLDALDTMFRNSIAGFSVDSAPKLSVKATRFGVRIFTDRRVSADEKLLRITNFVMPNACAIGGYEVGLGRGGSTMTFHVPIDDEHHWRFDFTFHSKAPLPFDDMDKYYGSEKLDGGRMERTRENRYLQDRAAMSETYLGMGGVFPVHDIFVTESQGVVHDHGDEHLVSSDVAIVFTRRMILDEIANVQAGKDPRGVVRDKKTNDFRDLVVLTEQLPADIDNEAFCAKLEKENIFELNPEIAEQSRALQSAK